MVGGNHGLAVSSVLAAWGPPVPTVAMGEIIVSRGVVPLEDTSFGTKALMASVILEDFCLHVYVCVFRHQTLAVLYEKEADHGLNHGLKLIPTHAGGQRRIEAIDSLVCFDEKGP